MLFLFHFFLSLSSSLSQFLSLDWKSKQSVGDRHVTSVKIRRWATKTFIIIPNRTDFFLFFCCVLPSRGARPTGSRERTGHASLKTASRAWPSKHTEQSRLRRPGAWARQSAPIQPAVFMCKLYSPIHYLPPSHGRGGGDVTYWKEKLETSFELFKRASISYKCIHWSFQICAIIYSECCLQWIVWNNKQYLHLCWYNLKLNYRNHDNM